MKKFDNILIASDMDGTFLGTNSRVVPQNIEAIKYFSQNGGHFTFITGRAYPAVAKIPGIIDLVTAPIAFHNGAYLYDTKKHLILDQTLIPAQPLVEVINYLIRLDQSIIFTVRSAFNYYGLEGRIYKDPPPEYLRNAFSIVPAEELPRLNISKFALSGTPEQISEIRNYIENNFGRYMDCTSSSEIFIEVIPKGINKGSAIAKLRSLNGFENTKIFAVGDYENDLPMLEVADYSVCPENSLACVKTASNIHVCHNDMGCIADLIHIIEENYVGRI